MSKYDPLKQYLESRPATTSSVVLDFREIEEILGFKLPKSGHKHRPWWANDATHSQAVWLTARWETRDPDIDSRRVTFVRGRSARGGPRAGAHTERAPRGGGLGVANARGALEPTRKRGWCGYEFLLVCPLGPDREESGQPREYLPQGAYRNAMSLPLHRYGAGPFCRFRIPANLHVGGVYLVTVNDAVHYVGECENLSSRFNMGYGQISPRNCYRGGQPTNCRVNRLILEAVKRRHRIELWFQETSARHAVERELIAKLGPPWNRQGKV